MWRNSKHVFFHRAPSQNLTRISTRGESAYAYHQGIGTLETTPQGERFLVRYSDGALVRSPIASFHITIAKLEREFELVRENVPDAHCL
jgi:hypothetical protein